MSYVEQSRRRNPLAVAAAIGTQLAIGYVLLSGLAYQIIKPAKHDTLVSFPVDQPPPPPKPHDLTPPKPHQFTETQPLPQPLAHDDFKPLPIPNPIPWTEPGLSGGGNGGTIEPPQPPRPNLSRDAVPGTDRLRWITTEDYPAAALRANMQGVVVVAATIGADGKVRSCLVTQSSGSQLLDDTTCRLYTRRAHFTPARDADGNPTTAQRVDRYRWQIPNE